MALRRRGQEVHHPLPSRGFIHRSMGLQVGAAELKGNDAMTGEGAGGTGSPKGAGLWHYEAGSDWRHDKVERRVVKRLPVGADIQEPNASPEGVSLGIGGQVAAPNSVAPSARSSPSRPMTRKSCQPSG